MVHSFDQACHLDGEDFLATLVQLRFVFWHKWMLRVVTCQYQVGTVDKLSTDMLVWAWLSLSDARCEGGVHLPFIADTLYIDFADDELLLILESLRTT